jgi:hypothetical protein
MKPPKFDEYFKIVAAVSFASGVAGYVRETDEGGVYVVAADDDTFFVPWAMSMLYTGPNATLHVEKIFREKRDPDLKNDVL